MQHVMSTLGLELDEAALDVLLASIDRNSDAKIDFSEFCQAFTFKFTL